MNYLRPSCRTAQAAPHILQISSIATAAPRVACRVPKRHFAVQADVSSAGTTVTGAKIKPNNKFFQVSEEVRHAASTGQPVVALESTIYTHGSWPYPENMQMALDFEKRVREHGAVPATIAVVDGAAHVGLSRTLLERLLDPQASQGSLELTRVRKLSRRDLAPILGRFQSYGARGGTTIAGTMILAHLSGIKVFATGGLGGVHRGAESSMDISADLTELGRTPVAVISSGCKGFLDISRTLEYLETQGVVVATFADGRQGPAVDFPAFWSRDSGVKSPTILRDEKEAAAIIHAQSELSMTSGLLFANPVSAKDEISLPQISSVIDQALANADREGITGADNTPFVLNQIRDITNGRSIKTNYALVEGNIIRGSRVAVELSKLELSHSSGSSIHQPNLEQHSTFKEAPLLRSSSQDSSGKDLEASSDLTFASPADRIQPPDVLVAGAVAVDLSCSYVPPRHIKEASTNDDNIMPKLNTSNPAEITHSVGGVAHNVARTLHLLGSNVLLSSAIGNDLAGKTVLDALKAAGLDTRAIHQHNYSKGQAGRTAQYVAVNDAKRNLHLAMADMDIFTLPHSELAAKWHEHPIILDALSSSSPEGGRRGVKWLVLDANWSAEALAGWLSLARRSHSTLQMAYEPVSVAKSLRLFDTLGYYPTPSAFPSSLSSSSSMRLVDLATPNALELGAMHAHASTLGLFERADWWTHIDALGISSSGARPELVRLTSSALVDAGIPQQAIRLLPFIPTIVTKLGAHGVLLTRLLRKDDDAITLRSAAAAPYILSRTKTDVEGVEVGGLYMRLFPAVETLADGDIVSVNGAGDTFLGALIAGLSVNASATEADGDEPRVEDVIDFAQRASVLTLRSAEAVNPHLGVILRPQLHDWAQTLLRRRHSAGSR